MLTIRFAEGFVVMESWNQSGCRDMHEHSTESKGSLKLAMFSFGFFTRLRIFCFFAAAHMLRFGPKAICVTFSGILWDLLRAGAREPCATINRVPAKCIFHMTALFVLFFFRKYPTQKYPSDWEQNVRYTRSAIRGLQNPT